MNLKIVVAGAFSSGKTKFCETLAGYRFRHCEKLENDIGMDYWDFEIDSEHKLQLYTPPGARRADNMWEILAEDLIGFVVMVDSAKPETFRECRSIWETFRVYAPVPYVIAANKQDLTDAWDIDALRVALRFSRETPIIPCVATHQKSVANVLIALCEEVLLEINTGVWVP
jgi:hypothetical protein